MQSARLTFHTGVPTTGNKAAGSGTWADRSVVVPLERVGNVIRNSGQILFTANATAVPRPAYWALSAYSRPDTYMFYGPMNASAPQIPANTDWSIAAGAISVTLS